MDPWLTDGEYYGSWCHYPYYDLDKNINEINSYNAIYISHIHPDHSSENTLKKISKEIDIDLNIIDTPLSKKLKNFKLIGVVEKGKFIKLLAKGDFGNDKFLDISMKNLFKLITFKFFKLCAFL